MVEKIICMEYGFKVILKDSLNDYDIVVTIGPVIMMKNVCDVTKKEDILNLIEYGVVSKPESEDKAMALIYQQPQRHRLLHTCK